MARQGDELPRIHLVTDDGVLRAPSFLETAHAILAEYGAGIALHLRGHGLTGGEIYRLAAELGPAADEGGGTLLINDRVDVVLTTGAAGVQLGRRSIPVGVVRDLLGDEAWIGYSAHSLDEVLESERAGVDYVVYGTIFPSDTHPGEPTAGLDGLAEMAGAATLPLIAIGGMNPERVAEVRAAGAYGVAILGAVWHSKDPLRVVAALQREIEEVRS